MLIPTNHSLMRSGRSNDETDDSVSPSNEEMSLNEDPMNLVETSWDISRPNINGNNANGAGASNRTPISLNN